MVAAVCAELFRDNHRSSRKVPCSRVIVKWRESDGPRNLRDLVGSPLDNDQAANGATSDHATRRQFPEARPTGPALGSAFGIGNGDAVRFAAGRIRSSTRFILDPCLIRNPVDFPGFAPIIRERLLKVG